MPQTRLATPKEIELLKAKEQELILQKNLPHLHGYKMYPWMRSYYESRNKVCLICSANQIGKSSIQIRKAVHWATSVRLKKELWPHLEPRQFWYLYPSSYVATIEFEKKWVPEFLPRGDLKKHPQYGWASDYRSKYIQALHFNTGISIYFKTYSQDPQDLQAGTCSAIFTDEELPEELYPELQMRLAATDGYFSAVFTPTLGQEFWRTAIENRGIQERFPEALKLQVSMYDCLLYEDGTNSFWSKDRIRKIESSCKSDAEIQRRVHGKFVLDSGLRYQSFSPSHNVIPQRATPDDWIVYIGVDFGSGGKFNHPSAVTFVAMNPNMKEGHVFKGIRFDGQTLTASDLVDYVRVTKAALKNPIAGVYYDWAVPDLLNISTQMGEPWIRADKAHLIGEQIINVAFKNKMLSLYDIEELEPLTSELKSLRTSTAKNQAKDDFIDALRYAVSKVPWDWSDVGKNEVPRTAKELTEAENRKKYFLSDQIPNDDVDMEIAEWNSLMEME